MTSFMSEDAKLLKSNIDANVASIMEVKQAIDGVQNDCNNENNKKIAGALAQESGVDAWNSSTILYSRRFR